MPLNGKLSLLLSVKILQMYKRSLIFEKYFCSLNTLDQDTVVALVMGNIRYLRSTERQQSSPWKMKTPSPVNSANMALCMDWLVFQIEIAPLALFNKSDGILATRNLICAAEIQMHGAALLPKPWEKWTMLFPWHLESFTWVFPKAFPKLLRAFEPFLNACPQCAFKREFSEACSVRSHPSWPQPLESSSPCSHICHPAQSGSNSKQHS